MGVAGPILKLRPSNFAKSYNFYRCINDISMTFWYLKWFQIYKKSHPTSYPVLESSLPKDSSLLLSPTSERRCSKMMINHGFFSRYCINLLRKWILYIKIFVCQGRCYNFKPLTCSMSPGPNCPVCPTPYSSTNAFQSLGNLYEGLWSIQVLIFHKTRTTNTYKNICQK